MVFNRRTVVGLHVTDADLKLLVVRILRQRVHIEQFASHSLPEGVVSEGVVQQPSVLRTFLKLAVKKARAERLKTVLALPMHHVMCRRVHIPAGLTVDEQEAEILAHVQHEAVAYDFVSIGMPRDDFQEMLLITVPHTFLQSYVTVAQQAKLKITAVDVDLYAYLRTMSVAEPIEKIMWNSATSTIELFLKQYFENSISLNTWYSSNFISSRIDTSLLQQHAEEWRIAFGLATRGVVYA